MKIENLKTVDIQAQDEKSSCVFARAFNFNVVHSNFGLLNLFAQKAKKAKAEIALIFKQIMKKALANLLGAFAKKLKALANLCDHILKIYYYSILKLFL